MFIRWSWGCPGMMLEKFWKRSGGILKKFQSSAGEFMERLCGNSLVVDKCWRNHGEVLDESWKFMWKS